ncbi:ABC transporter permease [Neorhizobium petrolearium]|uniref:ABC transporter permease n=1 Tax=Neorhizobium petrolearium TaxID=515361 RepID=A0ABY8M0L3_9HYPH|nr:ABC transporter permease [Neorhizobium petrolearium]MCC2613005.1 ABC transporter permease [Neorhizobium petrolearium]WGI68107.1 ABC transporter permease [Neorhizobium petrolearium]
MTVFVIRRFLQSIAVLLVTAIIVFIGIYAIGDPIEMLISPDASPAERAQVITSLGLDKPLWQQFLTFAWNALHGDLGRSFVFNRPSISLIFERLPATLELTLTGLVFALVLGIPLGLLSGLKPNSATDEAIMTGSIFGFSLPSFWQGMMLIMIFSVWLGWLPSTGRGQMGEFLGIRSSLFTLDGLAHLILPAINLSLFKLSLVIRLTRTGVRETLPLDFVKFARAKGLSEKRIVFVHVFKSILIPLITVVGLELGSMLAFAVVTETIFAWPGIGKLLIDSIMRLDRPVVVAYLLVIVSLFIFINFVVDILYSLVDPRVRLGDAQ